MKRMSAEQFRKLHGPRYKPGLRAGVGRPKEKDIQRAIVADLRARGFVEAADLHTYLLQTRGKGYTRDDLVWYCLAYKIAGIYEVTGTHRRTGDYQGTMMTKGVSDIQVYEFEQRGDIEGGYWRMIEVKRDAKAKVTPEQNIKRMMGACEIKFEI